ARSRRGRYRCARACRGCLPVVGRGEEARRGRAVQSAEVDAAGAGALELVEAVDRGERRERVQQLPGLLAPRGRGDDGAEVGGALAEGDHRGAHVVADAGGGALVRGAQRRVDLVSGDRLVGLDQLGGQIRVGERGDRGGATV